VKEEDEEEDEDEEENNEFIHLPTCKFIFALNIIEKIN